MANTFLFAQGFNMGKSLIEKDLIVEAKQILEKSKYFSEKRFCVVVNGFALSVFWFF